MSGQHVIIKISIINLMNKIIDDLNIGIAFYTISGHFLCACGSRPGGVKYSKKHKHFYHGWYGLVKILQNNRAHRN